MLCKLSQDSALPSSLTLRTIQLVSTPRPGWTDSREKGLDKEPEQLEVEGEPEERSFRSSDWITKAGCAAGAREWKTEHRHLVKSFCVTLIFETNISFVLESPVHSLIGAAAADLKLPWWHNDWTSWEHTVASVLTHTCRWTPKSMGYYRVWVLAELPPGPFFGSNNAVSCFIWLYTE